MSLCSEKRLTRILIGVHGRFHGFDLARALSLKGIEVHLATNYPKRVVRRFDVGSTQVHSFVMHGIFCRLVSKLGERAVRLFEPFVHKWFGSQIADLAHRSDYDLVHMFSGIAEEQLRRNSGSAMNTIVRGSSHILTQNELMTQEECRLNHKVEKPSRWMIDREMREYELADRIVVLSEFARESFLSHGFSNEKVRKIPLGVQLSSFKATPSHLAARAARLQSEGPIKVLFVGTFSARKGAVDFIEVARKLHKQFQFTVVADILPDAAKLVEQSKSFIQYLPRVPQSQLPMIYGEHDVFLFPTIEDGFAAVLAQAFAAGLPIISTPNCGARDIFEDGKGGWIVPIRSPAEIHSRLLEINRNRQEIALHLGEGQDDNFRTWDDAATDLLNLAMTYVRR